ncbi:porin family protein [bacterium]|nr:porin family protein [bacterium]
MKFTVLFRYSLIVCMFWMFSSGSPASCQDLSVELMFNHNEASGEMGDRYSGTFGGGLGLTYMFNKYVGVRTSANYLKFTRDYDGNDFGIIRLNIDAEVAYPITEYFRIYGLAGMGLYMWDVDRAWWIDMEAEDGADIGYNWGFGVNYSICGNMDITAAYNRHSVEFRDSTERYKWSEVSLGVSFHFDPKIFEH